MTLASLGLPFHFSLFVASLLNLTAINMDLLFIRLLFNPNSVFLQKFSKVDVEQWHLPVWVSHFTILSKLIESYCYKYGFIVHSFVCLTPPEMSSDRSFQRWMSNSDTCQSGPPIPLFTILSKLIESYCYKYAFIIIIDRFYIALFSALEQIHCARVWFYMSE